MVLVEDRQTEAVSGQEEVVPAWFLRDLGSGSKSLCLCLFLSVSSGCTVRPSVRHYLRERTMQRRSLNNMFMETE